MGWTSENVAGDYRISRQEMDQFAYLYDTHSLDGISSTIPWLNFDLHHFDRSHTRASKADKAGLFEKEIIPMEINKKDPETGTTSRITVTKDDVIRFAPPAECSSVIDTF